MNSKLATSLIAAAVMATAVTGSISYSYAQDSKVDTKKAAGTPFVDGEVMMRDNKMWVRRSGKDELMDKDITMSNGTRVTRMGEFFTKDGIKKMFKNGQRMNPKGEFHGGQGEG
jgi:hypothetical protein